MNKIATEILKCMSEFKQTEDGKLCAHFIFPDNFIGFDGHFINKKILPGICKIQAAIIMLKTYYKKNVFLKEINQSKFLYPVTSNEEIVFECLINNEKDNEYQVKVLVFFKDKKVAELKMKVHVKK